MCKDDSKATEVRELDELDELDGVTGGVTISAAGSKAETVEISCPKCGSRDIAGVEITHFSYASDASNFLDTTNLMCKKCHFFAKGRKFRIRTV